jgi:hypothetical protein
VSTLVAYRFVEVKGKIKVNRGIICSHEKYILEMTAIKVVSSDKYTSLCVCTSMEGHVRPTTKNVSKTE